MLTQYGPQRFRTDSRGRRVGTVPVGSIVYLQDGVRPFNGPSGRPQLREPSIVVAWHNRELFGKRLSGGHLATVKSLRDGQETQIADWILVRHDDAGLMFQKA